MTLETIGFGLAVFVPVALILSLLVGERLRRARMTPAERDAEDRERRERGYEGDT